MRGEACLRHARQTTDTGVALVKPLGPRLERTAEVGGGQRTSVGRGVASGSGTGSSTRTRTTGNRVKCVGEDSNRASGRSWHMEIDQCARESSRSRGCHHG